MPKKATSASKHPSQYCRLMHETRGRQNCKAKAIVPCWKCLISSEAVWLSFYIKAGFLPSICCFFFLTSLFSALPLTCSFFPHRTLWIQSRLFPQSDYRTTTTSDHHHHHHHPWTNSWPGPGWKSTLWSTCLEAISAQKCHPSSPLSP